MSDNTPGTASRWCAVHDEPAAECWSAGCLGRGPMTLTDFLLARIAEDEAWLAPVPTHSGRQRGLKECDAKRRIAAIAADMAMGHEVRGMTLLHLLALPYADHPDYREEWKP